MTTGPDPLRTLPREECDRRLAGGYIGRLALDVGGAPMIYAMNYRYADGVVVMRTGSGGKVASASGDGVPAAFQIDGFDETYHSGWSVVVRGTLTAVEEHEVRDLVVRRPLRAWAHGPRDYWLRLDAAEVSGRAFG